MNNLTNITPIFEHVDRAVYAADSPEFGPVILKRDANIPQLKSEYKMLSRLNGNRCCRAYAFDEVNGLLLEERLLPGTVLREEISLERRINAFADVFRAIHTPETEGETYLDWLDAAKDNCKDAAWSARAYYAHAICRELFEKYADRMLLHGDLHHDNILLCADGSYAIIDPKAVVGPAILDIPRFILNEIGDAPAETAAPHIQNVIRLIAVRLSYPEKDIAKGFIMESILENLWNMEDGAEVVQQRLDIALRIAEEFHIPTF